MATIEQFKELQTALSSEDQAQIAELQLTDRDSAVSKMIAIANDKGVTLTSDEVQSFISELDEDDEFDDVELDAATLSAIYGGGRGGTGNYTTNHGDAVLVCVQCVSGFLEGTSDGQTGTF